MLKAITIVATAMIAIAGLTNFVAAQTNPDTTGSLSHEPMKGIKSTSMMRKHKMKHHHRMRHGTMKKPMSSGGM